MIIWFSSSRFDKVYVFPKPLSQLDIQKTVLDFSFTVIYQKILKAILRTSIFY